MPSAFLSSIRIAGFAFLICGAALATPLGTSGFGALAADAVLQSLGLAPLIPLLAFAPESLGFTRPGARWSGLRKCVFSFAAAIAFAGALSAVPLKDDSILRHGLGGLLGEAVLDTTSSALMSFGSFAPLVLLAAGAYALVRTRGWTWLSKRKTDSARAAFAGRIEPEFECRANQDASDINLAIARRFAPSRAVRHKAFHDEHPLARSGDARLEANDEAEANTQQELERKSARGLEVILARHGIERAFHAILPLAIGVGANGDAIVADLARLGHVIFTGEEESELRMGLHAVAASLLDRQPPEACRLIMIDAGGLALAAYDGVPHLLAPVVQNEEQAAYALAWAASEMERRQTRMAKLAVSSMESFNRRARASAARGEELFRLVHTGFEATGEATLIREPLESEPMSRIVILIHDLDGSGKEKRRIANAIRCIARSGANSGFHLVMTARAPFASVLTRAINAGYPARVCYKVSSRIDSRMAVGGYGAERLLGEGDLLFSSCTDAAMRLKGPFISHDEIVAFARRHGAHESPPSNVPRKYSHDPRSDARPTYPAQAARAA